MMDSSTTPASPSSLSIRGTLVLFGIALVTRLILLGLGPWQYPERAIWGDGSRYLVLGENLLTYHSFAMREEEPSPAWRNISLLREANGTLPARDANGLLPEGFRTPGYPAFILAIRGCSGGPRAVLLAQCLLGALLACLVPAIALALGVSARGAFLAGLLWALHPTLVLRDCLILTESLFNICAVVALFCATRSQSRWGWLTAGALIGAAGLVRPLGLLYLPAVLVLVWPRARPRLPALAAVVALAALPSALWCARNQSVGNGFRTATVADLTLLYHMAGYSISEERGVDWLDNWLPRCEELGAKLKERVQPGEDVIAAARRLAIEEILARPGMAARVLVKSQIKLLVSHSLGDLYHVLDLPYQPSNLFAQLVLRENTGTAARSPVPLVAALGWTALNVAILVAALVGLVLGLRRRTYALLLFCGLTIVLFAVATMSQGTERMRMPILLPLFVLAGNVVPARKAAPSNA